MFSLCQFLSKRFALLVLLFYLCFFLLFSSGRVASGDAGQQLQATMLLVNTGSLGTKTPPGGLDSGWVLSSNGNYYQPHDIGNILLMLPSAWLGSVTSKEPPAIRIEKPPILSRVSVALTYSCLSSIGCFFMFKLFASWYSLRTAFLLSFAFATTTIFWSYTKASWDVMGACCLICCLLYFSAQILQGKRVRQNIIFAGASLALACSFRFSLLPFLGLGLACLLYYSRQYFTWWHYLTCTATVIVGLIPSFVYNYIRMGAIWRPATTAPQYLEGNNALTGNILHGSLGLLFAPNGGLFFYSPIFILLFSLPFVWQYIAIDKRRLILCYGISAFLNFLLIAKLQNWGAFGWGPRYLLPVQPILFIAVGIVIEIFWNKHHKALVTLISASILLNIPPILVNWDLVTAISPNALDRSAFLPNQQIAVWTSLFMGLQGKQIPISNELANESTRSIAVIFPDLWTVRIMEMSPIGVVIGLIIMLFLSITAVLAFIKLIGKNNNNADFQNQRC